jgi:hemoglobin
MMRNSFDHPPDHLPFARLRAGSGQEEVEIVSGGHPFFSNLLGTGGVRALVDRFYDRMATDPEAAGILALHEDLPRAREKLYLFLVGWTGGPQLYVEQYGHPRLRARHLPFAIGEAERDAWLLCMSRAVEETVPDADLRAALMRAFVPLAHHMINQPR